MSKIIKPIVHDSHRETQDQNKNVICGTRIYVSVHCKSELWYISEIVGVCVIPHFSHLSQLSQVAHTQLGPLLFQSFVDCDVLHQLSRLYTLIHCLPVPTDQTHW